MTSENLLSTPLITPVYNSRPELPPPALASWNDVLGAYKNAWDALDEVDDHHTAFLAIQVAHDAVQAYGSNLTTRPPKDGDLANLLHLRQHLDKSYSQHDTFTDEAHVDYAVLRKTVLSELQTLQENATRRAALHAVGLACAVFPPLSYSSSIEDMHLIEQAVHFIESYRAMEPLFLQQFDVKPLAGALQTIATQESKGFSDYKDAEFATLFEALTVRIGKLHLGR